jgi:Eco57I restriction-modification methylase
MDLFSAAGIDVGDGGRGGRSGRAAVSRTLRIPLLNPKVVADALKRFTFDFTPEQLAAGANYAKTVKSSHFRTQKETAVRPVFIQKVLREILGYRTLEPDVPYDLAFEHPIRHGAVDVALGKFGAGDDDRIVAPFELKGPTTTDLDTIMSGRGRSPVQQAWDYAMDAPTSRWVLVSNCVEIRLYGFGRGRDAFELFDLTKLDDRSELERLWFILSSNRFLGGASEELLRTSDSTYRSITDKLYDQYSELRGELLQYLTDSADGPKLSLLQSIEATQKLLDRILFIAFAQGTGLVRRDLLDIAATSKNQLDPQPLWNNLRNLFQHMNIGYVNLGISEFNGGLFAADPVVDIIAVPDILTEKIIELRKWDYGSDVPVTVLGHIFEQSITDLEKLRAEARGEESPGVSKRKLQGVVYTPDIVTRFLVEHTIGATLAECKARLLGPYEKSPLPRGSRDELFKPNESAIEKAFWQGYLTALRALRIVDPACGSGAFLVAAFDKLKEEYRLVVERLDALGEGVDFDPFDEIVSKNLYGVDLNPESVEITRLSLWLKTARDKHKLQNLEVNIKVGNSLIDDEEYPDRPFNWQTQFPDIFPKGGDNPGFDVVIGNPPYVRSERLSSMKPWLKKNYAVFDGGSDLYCYFYERGLQILKNTGRLGFISSCGFFKTAFGEPLRRYLREEVTFECGIDFGDARIFEDVTTYPTVLTLRKQKPLSRYEILFLNYSGNGRDDLTSAFIADSFSFPSERLDRSRWHFEVQSLWRLRDNLEKASKIRLGEVCAPVSGIKTGLTKAFVISETSRASLIAQDGRSVEIIRSWTVGDDLARWAPEPAKEYLLFLPKGWTKAQFRETTELAAWSEFEGRYSAVASWLKTFETKAQKRSDKGDFWWELRACDYYDLFDEALVTYPEMSQGPKFSLKRKGVVSNNKTFLIPKSNPATLAFLNSRVSWFLLSGICTALRGGQWRLELRADFLKELPLPDFGSPLSRKLKNSGELCEQLTLRLYEIRDSFLHRVLTDLAPPEHQKLSAKLEKFWTLDFAAFRAELKKTVRTEIPVNDRHGWEKYLAEKSAEIIKLRTEIKATECGIDAIVYKLFDLTPDEIKLLEDSLEGQY